MGVVVTGIWRVHFKLRGEAFSISPDDVRRVTRHATPNPADTRNKYFVEIHGRRFPIKQTLCLVTGLPPVGFTAQDAHRILSRLGFDIFEQQATTTASARPDPAPGASGTGHTGDQHGDDIRHLLVVFQTDEDGWEVASCPTLPGCHSQGRTREEALANVQEAIRGYLASLREHGAAPPPSSEFQVIEVRV